MSDAQQDNTDDDERDDYEPEYDQCPICGGMRLNGCFYGCPNR